MVDSSGIDSGNEGGIARPTGCPWLAQVKRDKKFASSTLVTQVKRVPPRSVRRVGQKQRVVDSSHQDDLNLLDALPILERC
jgi:hypothetical protein